MSDTSEIKSALIDLTAAVRILFESQVPTESDGEIYRLLNSVETAISEIDFKAA